jgi:alkyl hydroperoxide reductase subunit AhpC
LGCASCGKNKRGDGYIEPKALDAPPFAARDIMIYEPFNDAVRKFNADDWSGDRHKLLLFFPETFTPVCQTEMGALNQWVEEFDKLGVDVFGATTDPIHAVKDWYEQDDVLRGSNYRVISSYILTSRLGILNNGRSKRASVFITKEGDVVIQEHFLKVGRSIAELHRMMHGYTTGSYCSEGWISPEDGFLKK